MSRPSTRQHTQPFQDTHDRQQQPITPPRRPLQTQHRSYDRNSPPQGQSPSRNNHPQTAPSYQQYPDQVYSPTRSVPSSPQEHPDNSFNRLRSARRYSRSQENPNFRLQQNYHDAGSPVTETTHHRDGEGRNWGRESGYTTSGYSNITPGADNFGEQAAGGLTGVAMSVADSRARESGLEAMRNAPAGYEHQDSQYQDSPYQQHPQVPAYQPYSHESAYQNQQEPLYQQHSQDTPFVDPYARPQQLQRLEHSQSSLTPIGAAAFPPGMSTPQSRSIVSRSPPPSFTHDPYSDNPYNNAGSHRYSRNLDPTMTSDFDPNSIEDDGDDGLEYSGRRDNRSSMLGLSNNSNRAVPTGAKVAGAGGIIGAIGGLVTRKPVGGSAEPQYDAVHNAAAGPTAYGGAGGANGHDVGTAQEKSAWLNKQQKGNKRLWCIGSFLVVLIVIGAVVGGVVYALTHKSAKSSSSTSGQSASGDTAQNGDLNLQSAEIQALLNNKNLHKVFPGIDYTPMYTQYPGCLTYPASQNNVTRDLAVLSQLTNTIRLYGTDCNQTELLLHSIDQLKMNDTIKVWMGVWLDTNQTTNARQLAQMYDIVDKYGADPFAGVIIGNEVLFREDMTETELAAVITGVKSNLTAKGVTMSVASSDLGDNWTSSFAGVVDFIMANIHPFFAGVSADQAAAWTYEFWTGHDTILTTNATKNIISETGWPSKGGTDCGSSTVTTCTNGSVAGIDEMNEFMNTWVCDALTNGTNYFWFEAFDEPWKISFDTPGQEWEDQWGLMDVNRNLKPGVVIPSCGGKTV